MAANKKNLDSALDKLIGNEFPSSVQSEDDRAASFPKDIQPEPENHSDSSNDLIIEYADGLEEKQPTLSKPKPEKKTKDKLYEMPPDTIQTTIYLNKDLKRDIELLAKHYGLKTNNKFYVAILEKVVASQETLLKSLRTLDPDEDGLLKLLDKIGWPFSWIIIKIKSLFGILL